jgi:hypothetical protein
MQFRGAEGPFLTGSKITSPVLNWVVVDLATMVKHGEVRRSMRFSTEKREIRPPRDADQGI